MSAMPALDWPEDDPASETDATWTFPDWLMPAKTTRRPSSPDQPARPQAPSVPAARVPRVRVQVVQARAPHGTTGPSPLRLTRRGRIVVAAAAALLVTLMSLLLTGGAWAAGPAAPAHGANRSLAQVVVLPGQSLWSVAQTAEPNADPRQVMQQIIELNGLAGDTIQAGTRLWVPRG